MRPGIRNGTIRVSRKSRMLLWSALGFAAIFWTTAGCHETSVEREFFRTGIETKKLPDGGIRIIAVARASENAIRSGRIAMKIATCREAAILLMRQELSRRDHYPRAMAFYRSLSFELFQDGDYCQLIGFYGELPAQYKTPKKSDQEILKPGEKSITEEQRDGDLKDFDRKILGTAP